MTNVASLVPITKGDPRGGRKPGQVNRTTRALKTALLLAAEESEHSKDRGRSLLGYCTWLADKRPELYVSMLARLVPLQARVTTSTEIPKLTADMPIEEMIANFEWKLKSGYRVPCTIEHEDVDDGDTT